MVLRRLFVNMIVPFFVLLYVVSAHAVHLQQSDTVNIAEIEEKVFVSANKHKIRFWQNGHHEWRADVTQFSSDIEHENFLVKFDDGWSMQRLNQSRQEDSKYYLHVYFNCDVPDALDADGLVFVGNSGLRGGGKYWQQLMGTMRVQTGVRGGWPNRFVCGRFSSSNSRVVFLGIDGVLQPHKSNESEQWQDYDLKHLQQQLADEKDKQYSKINRHHIAAVHYGWDKEAVHNLCNLCDETQARIVVSSHWRRYYTLQQLKLLFGIHKMDPYVVGTTPTLGKADGAAEVQRYLDAHKEIESFVILGDENAGVERQFFNQFIYCPCKFDKPHYEIALFTLQQQPNVDLAQLEPVLNFERLRNNDPSLTELRLGAVQMAILCRHYGWHIAILRSELCVALMDNTHLQKLTISDLHYKSPCGIYPSSARILIDTIAQIPSMKYLDIANNNWVDRQTILSALKKSKSLRIVRL